jgi:hypothetical protein
MDDQPVTGKASGTPCDIKGQAGERITLANNAVYQINVLLNALTEEIGGLNDEGSFMAMALASRSKRLAAAAGRLLSLPDDEIDVEACEAEVLHG